MAFMKISDMDLNDFPASLYIAVGDKDNALIRVDESSNFEFERFISSVVQLYAGQNVIPDLWLYRLDFPEKKMIPDITLRLIKFVYSQKKVSVAT